MQHERGLAEYHVEPGDQLLAVFQTIQLRPYTSRLLITQKTIGAGLDYRNAYTFKPQNAYRRDQLAIVAYEPEGYMSLRAIDGRRARFKLLYPEELPALRKALPPIAHAPAAAHTRNIEPQQRRSPVEEVRNEDSQQEEKPDQRNDRLEPRVRTNRASKVDEIANDLATLGDLLDRGLITGEEFEKLKKRRLED